MEMRKLGFTSPQVFEAVTSYMWTGKASSALSVPDILRLVQLFRTWGITAPAEVEQVANIVLTRAPYYLPAVSAQTVSPPKFKLTDTQTNACGFISVNGHVGARLTILESPDFFRSECGLAAYLTIQNSLDMEQLWLYAQTYASTLEGVSTMRISDCALLEAIVLANRKPSEGTAFKSETYTGVLNVVIRDNPKLTMIQSLSEKVDISLWNANFTVLNCPELRTFWYDSDPFNDPRATFLSINLDASEFVLDNTGIDIFYCAILHLTGSNSRYTVQNNAKLTFAELQFTAPSEVLQSPLTAGFAILYKSNPLLESLRFPCAGMNYITVTIQANSSIKRIELINYDREGVFVNAILTRCSFNIVLNPGLDVLDLYWLSELWRGQDQGTGTPNGCHLTIFYNANMTAVRLPNLTTIEHVTGAPQTMRISHNAKLLFIYMPKAVFGSGCILEFQDNALFSGAVDHLLQRCVESPEFRAGSSINCLSNNPPTAIGLGYKAILEARGVTVLVDPPVFP